MSRTYETAVHLTTTELMLLRSSIVDSETGQYLSAGAFSLDEKLYAAQLRIDEYRQREHDEVVRV